MGGQKLGYCTPTCSCGHGGNLIWHRYIQIYIFATLYAVVKTKNCMFFEKTFRGRNSSPNCYKTCVLACGIQWHFIPIDDVRMYRNVLFSHIRKRISRPHTTLRSFGDPVFRTSLRHPKTTPIFVWAYHTQTRLTCYALYWHGSCHL